MEAFSVIKMAMKKRNASSACLKVLYFFSVVIVWFHELKKSAILVHDWNRDCSVCYGHSRFWCMFYKYRTKLTFKALTCRNQYVYKNNKDNRQFYWLQLPDNQFYFCKKLIFQRNLIGIPDHMYILSIADTDMKHVAIFEHSLLKVYWMRT